MASPQKENGYTPLANEILERLVNTPLLGSEFQVLLFIIRKTWGYHKKEDKISLTQFEKGTGLSRPTIVKTLKNLVSRNMVVKVYLPDDNCGYTFIKDHEKWVVKTHLLVKGKWETGKPVLTKTSKDVLTHKRKKDNKRNIVASDKPFYLEEEIEKLENSDRRDLNILALYLEERKPELNNYAQYDQAIKRHIKSAGKLIAFDDKQILKAVNYAKREYKDIWTIDTLLKILTK